MLRTAGPVWREHGISPDVLSTGSHVGPYAPTLEAAGYGVHHLPFSRDPGFTLDYVAFLRRTPYDLVHIHTERASAHLGIATRILGLAAVRTVHSNFRFEGVLRRRRTIQRRLARLAGVRHVAVGPTVAANEARRFNNPTTIVANWIDTASFTPTTDDMRRDARARFGLSSDDFVAVVVGNCAPTKNHDALVRAVAALRIPLLLLHVGEEDRLQSEQALLRNLGAGDRCRFLGRTDPLPALRAADLFVMPSLNEGLGMASLEALSTGLPAVLTEVPGSVDLRSLSDDIIWCFTDPCGLRDSLETAYERFNRPRAHTVRRAQAERVRALHGVESGVAGYARIYRKSFA